MEKINSIMGLSKNLLNGVMETISEEWSQESGEVEKNTRTRRGSPGATVVWK